MDVSIVIPTMNRPQLLQRLVHYYDSLQFQGKILIGDSSDPAVFEASARVLETYASRLDILHLHLPQRSVAAAVRELNEHLTTRYVCLVPDDDFVIPKTIKGCIEFLENNSDYVAAHGVGMYVASSGEPAIIENAGFYNQTVADDETAAARLCKHLEHYSVDLFSVHRADTWHRMFSDLPSPSELPECCDKTFVDELLPCCLSVVYGKIKQIDGLYLVRGIHDARYHLPSWFAWMSGAKWHASYLYFRSRLAHAISIKDGIALSEAQRLVDGSFAVYVAQVVTSETRKVHWLRERAGRSRALTWAWRTLNILREGGRSRRRLTPRFLLNTSSPYREEFFPVFNAVTRPAATPGESKH